MNIIKGQSSPNYMSQGQIHVIALIALCIAITLPSMLKYLPESSDGLFAVMAYDSLSKQFFNGEAYPRWLFDMYNGHGSPMFYYYPPAMFYTELMIDALTGRWLSHTVLVSIVITMLHSISALTAYLWLRDKNSAQAAFIAAVIYALLPNHLAIDLYLKGTVAELAAYTFIPLILYCIGLTRQSNIGWIAVALSYALLITTTVPMAIAFTPFIMLYILYEYFMGDHKGSKRILSAFAGLVAGFTLAGFYIVTAYLMSDYILKEAIWADFYNPRNWFLCLFTCEGVLFPTHRPMNLLFSHLYSVQLFAIAGLGLYALKNIPARKNETLFWLVIAGGAFFMMTSPSLFIWDILPLLERIQFPWRLAFALDIAFIALLAICLSGGRPQSFKWPEALAIIGIMAFIFISIKTYHAVLNKPPTYEPATYEKMLANKDYLNMYMPAGKSFVFNEIHTREAPFISYDQGKTTLSYDTIPYGFRFDIDAGKAITVDIRQFYYPTLTAYSEISGEVFPFIIADNTSTVQINHSGDKDTIVFKYKTGQEEKTGWLITFVTIFVLAGFIIVEMMRGRKAR